MMRKVLLAVGLTLAVALLPLAAAAHEGHDHGTKTKKIKKPKPKEGQRRVRGTASAYLTFDGFQAVREKNRQLSAMA